MVKKKLCLNCIDDVKELAQKKAEMRELLASKQITADDSFAYGDRKLKQIKSSGNTMKNTRKQDNINRMN